MMKVAIASDHGGIISVKKLRNLMDEIEISMRILVVNVHTSVDYPDYALPVAEKVASGEFDQGILFVGQALA